MIATYVLAALLVILALHFALRPDVLPSGPVLILLTTGTTLAGTAQRRRDHVVLVGARVVASGGGPSEILGNIQIRSAAIACWQDGPDPLTQPPDGQL